MAKKVGTYQIPFDSNGNQQHYPESSWIGTWGSPDYKRVEPEWCPNEPFQDTLTFSGFSRGRSAAYFHFTRANGKTVCMFMKEMEELIPHMVKGVVTGTFQFVKRGQNYGCTKVADVWPNIAA